VAFAASNDKRAPETTTVRPEFAKRGRNVKDKAGQRDDHGADTRKAHRVCEERADMSTPHATRNPSMQSSFNDHDLRDVDRANATRRQPVIFLHGLWLLASSWQPWREWFEHSGYVAVTAGWHDDPETVGEANAHPEVFEVKTIGKVADAQPVETQSALIEFLSPFNSEARHRRWAVPASDRNISTSSQAGGNRDLECQSRKSRCSSWGRARPA
jgi:hypothetical protein